MWIISGNWCDDCWVEGIFSTEDKAQHYYDEFQKCTDMVYEIFEPEEWIVDEKENYKATKVYPVCINVETKETTKGKEKIIIETKEKFDYYYYNPFNDKIVKSNIISHLVYESSVSYEHAIEQLINYVGKNES